MNCINFALTFPFENGNFVIYLKSEHVHFLNNFNEKGNYICRKKKLPLSGTTKKVGLSNQLKYLFGVGDAGFVLMSNIETFYLCLFSPPRRFYTSRCRSHQLGILNWSTLPELDLRRYS
jgi:hypothetical protein